MDAKAEGSKIVIGGWRVKEGARTKDAEWFSTELTSSTAPWAYARGDPFRTIAALELLGTLVSLVVLVPEVNQRGDKSGLITMSCSTDNQGNSFLLDRLLTTRYPLGVILMQLAHEMRKRRMLLRARWVPRLQNQEADDLTNDEFRHFDLAKRIPVDLKDLGFQIMTDLFGVGDAYVEALDKERAELKAKAQSRSVKTSEKEFKRRRPLRESDPWV